MLWREWVRVVWKSWDVRKGRRKRYGVREVGPGYIIEGWDKCCAVITHTHRASCMSCLSMNQKIFTKIQPIWLIIFLLCFFHFHYHFVAIAATCYADLLCRRDCGVS